MKSSKTKKDFEHTFLKSVILIVLVLTILISIKEVYSVTGGGGNINITRGQLDSTAINTGSAFTLRGAVQLTADIGNSSIAVTRFGILQTNAAPVILIFDPVNDSYINDTNINFEWLVDDVNNETLTSLIELFNDSDLANIYHRNHTIQTNENRTIEAVKYNFTIVEESTYYWKIRANDTKFNSSFTEINYLTTDFTLPTNFNLTSPVNETTSTDTTPELKWNATTEANLQNYTIEFCTSLSCTSPSAKGTSTITSFSNWSISDTLEEGPIYWQVRATDKANNQRVSDLFLYVVDTSATETVQVTTGDGGGETLGGSGTHLYSLSIISPPDVTLFSNDTLTVPLVIKNPVTQLSLQGIELNITSDSEDIIATLGSNFIPILRPRDQVTVPLTIKSLTAEPSTYGITIIAKVNRPEFTDKVRILANLIEQDSAETRQISKQLGFAKDLLNGNPECLDLIEYIAQADQAIDEGKRNKALSLVENAIASCQKLIALERPLTGSTILEVPSVIRDNKTILILAAETLGFVLFILTIVKIVRRKKKPL